MDKEKELLYKRREKRSNENIKNERALLKGVFYFVGLLVIVSIIVQAPIELFGILIFVQILMVIGLLIGERPQTQEQIRLDKIEKEIVIPYPKPRETKPLEDNGNINRINEKLIELEKRIEKLENLKT